MAASQSELIEKLQAENRYLRNRYVDKEVNETCTGAETLGMQGQAYALKQESPEETIDYLFTFHDNPDKTPHYIEIREAAKTFAKVVIRHAPYSKDRLKAINFIRAAVMWSNASIALDGRSLQ